MSNKTIQKPTENCQDIKLQILKPLLNGLKILSIEEAEINEHCKGLTMLLKNKVGNNVRLFIEPNKDTTDLIISVYNPIWYKGVVKTSDYSAVYVKCLFYMSNNEIKDSIKCEGIFSASATHIFDNNRLKQEHKEKYCNTFDCKFCQHYIKVMSTYQT